MIPIDSQVRRSKVRHFLIYVWEKAYIFNKHLLFSRPGEVYKSSEVIKGQQITSHPDIRFNTFPQSATRGRVIRVVTMTEVFEIRSEIACRSGEI